MWSEMMMKWLVGPIKDCCSYLKSGMLGAADANISTCTHCVWWPQETQGGVCPVLSPHTIMPYCSYTTILLAGNQVQFLSLQPHVHGSTMTPLAVGTSLTDLTLLVLYWMKRQSPLPQTCRYHHNHNVTSSLWPGKCVVLRARSVTFMWTKYIVKYESSFGKISDYQCRKKGRHWSQA